MTKLNMIIRVENQGTKEDMFLSIQMSSAVNIFITPPVTHAFAFVIIDAGQHDNFHRH